MEGMGNHLSTFLHFENQREKISIPDFLPHPLALP